ncbi:MAG: hypothetical protein PHQ40_13485 [Anaerolineaceae bacterium]|nr:hypothetical protein [Anaerolineaceae bacterium]
MHAVLTFVLRLLVDSDTPGLLCGSLQQVPEEQPATFVDGQALLRLLEDASTAEGAPCPGETSEESRHPKDYDLLS